ncbi:MAG TPA: hypothetical protein PLK90_10890 [Clostridiales bacterium]|nr:hypothetical protein [Clostridiales bacterium]HQP70896.1 hypothetical protein [Clostridiales bacterium]
MKKLLTIFIYLNIACAYGGAIDFSVKIIYLKQDADLTNKLRIFEESLERQMDNYDWKFPHNDFEKIETSININIESLSSEKNGTGMLIISSGPATSAVKEIALKKDIYYSEQDMAFTLDYEADPKLDRMEPGTIETAVMFYSYLVLGENFDRLSYTDQKNFKLEGDYYYQKLYEFENLLTAAAERTVWSKRLDIINMYRMNTKLEIRKLHAYIYNAVYFINSGKKKRAKLFVEPMYESMTKVFDFPQNFFMNNFYAFGEIFSLSDDEKHIRYLIDKDPSHESFYSQKLRKSQENNIKKSE